MGVLGSGIVLAAADPPPVPSGVKPPYQRLLTGDDAKKAVELERQAAAAVEADDYRTAIKASEELLALRTRAQGRDHWETVMEWWTLETRKKISAMPAENRAVWRKAVQGAVKAQELGKKGAYGEARALLEEALRGCRELLGEDHPATALSYGSLALNLLERGQYADAEPLLRQALEIEVRVLGEEHPLTADSCSNLANNLRLLGKYTDAEPLFRRAVEIFRKVLGEEHPRTTIGYSSLALNLAALGRYADAEPLFRRALEIRRKVLGDDHPDTAHCYNNLDVHFVSPWAVIR